MRPDGEPGGFDYSLDYDAIDFRKQPELYRVGRGEQGVLLVEPYKSEILPFWRFKTPDIACESSTAIRALFDQYKREGDFVGMDMARKFLQMGWTRSRRYANRKSGRKYDTSSGALAPMEPDSGKAESARIFKEQYDAVRRDPEYLAMKRDWVDSSQSRKTSTT
jgi:hypothetical protein